MLMALYCVLADCWAMRSLAALAVASCFFPVEQVNELQQALLALVPFRDDDQSDVNRPCPWRPSASVLSCISGFGPSASNILEGPFKGMPG